VLASQYTWCPTDCNTHTHTHMAAGQHQLLVEMWMPACMVLPPPVQLMLTGVDGIFTRPGSEYTASAATSDVSPTRRISPGRAGGNRATRSPNRSPQKPRGQSTPASSLPAHTYTTADGRIINSVSDIEQRAPGSALASVFGFSDSGMFADEPVPIKDRSPTRIIFDQPYDMDGSTAARSAAAALYGQATHITPPISPGHLSAGGGGRAILQVGCAHSKCSPARQTLATVLNHRFHM
jgi:hypothetical protein